MPTVLTRIEPLKIAIRSVALTKWYAYTIPSTPLIIDFPFQIQVLQQHIDYFDLNKDDVITPLETHTPCIGV